MSMSFIKHFSFVQFERQQNWNPTSENKFCQWTDLNTSIQTAINIHLLNLSPKSPGFRHKIIQNSVLSFTGHSGQCNMIWLVLRIQVAVHCTVGKHVAGPKLLHIINSNTCHGLRSQKKLSKTVVSVGKNEVNMDTKNYKSRILSRNKGN